MTSTMSRLMVLPLIYWAAILLFPIPANAISVISVNGTLAPGDNRFRANGNYWDSYTFNANAGDRVQIRLASSAFNAYLLVYAPSGQLFTRGGTNSYPDFQVIQSGTWFAVVSAGSGSGETGLLSLSGYNAGIGAVTASYTLMVDVTPPVVPPTAAIFMIPLSGGVAPLTVNFYGNLLSQGSESYAWNFGDGSTSTASDPIHTFAIAGTYTVRLTVTNAAGSDTATQTITVTAPVAAPTANYTVSVVTGPAPLTIQFNNTSTGSGNTYVWTFGDGDSSTNTNPSHTFVNSGTYTVRLTATNAGGSHSVAYLITVTSPLPSAPVAAFTATPTSGNAPLAVSFSNQSTGNPASYRWDFGDGGTSDFANPSHTFTAASTYTVQLTATNSGGSGTATRTITVTAPLPAAPVAAFTPSATSGNAPLAVSFTNQSTGNPTSYWWDFGEDGGNTAGASPTYIYKKPGTYTVQLTATNAGGSSTTSATITVSASTPDPPVSAFTASVASGNAPLLVQFTNATTGSVDQYLWDFDDGLTSTDVNPTHTFNSAGTFTVRLTVTNAGGSSRNFGVITVVPAAPVAAFDYASTSGSTPLTVSFTNQSTGSDVSYVWNFGDGGTATGTDAVWTYSKPGIYTIQLTAASAGGSNSKLRTIHA